MTFLLTDLIPKNARLNRIIVCEYMNFIWDAPELKEIVKMWQMNLSIEYMANHFDRDPDEVIVAIIHLAREDKIIRRKEGLI
jgi:predicted regulator of amino acid metabolism with ACT domain